MLLGDFPIKREGSQGQNKTYLVALKLAQFDFLNVPGPLFPCCCWTISLTSWMPRVWSKSSSWWQATVLDRFFITDTNREHLDRILHKVGSDYKMFRVERGNGCRNEGGRGMKRNNAEQIGELIRHYLRQESLESPLNERRLISAWPEVLGPTIASYTRELYIKNQVLYVHLTSAALRQELMMGRELLVRNLNRHVGAQVITNIIFR